MELTTSETNKSKKIMVGSRKSELALIQTRYVISLLKEINPDKQFEIVTMSTLGDKVLDIPLPKIGEKSLFTKELETALATGCVDFVVHSLKDLPTCLPSGMAIGAVLEREDPRDALVLQKDNQRYELESLPKNSVIGTSSLRRTAQLARKYPHLKVENIRGNLNTRLRKLDELGQFHGIILAAAGLIRMGWNDRITKILDTDEIMYAVGQGALAVECRESDEKIIELLRPLYDLKTCLRVICERSFLKTLGGGCSAPVAITTDLTILSDHEIDVNIKGAVWSLDGVEEILDNDHCIVEIKDEIKRCSSCPYNKKLKDIESISDCEKCPNNITIKPSKRPRIETEISTNLLKSDPHDHCPITLPIGVDFMGKCPYLESGLVKNYGKCPVFGTVEGSILTQCPFFKNHLKFGNCSNDNESKTYCGLVPHIGLPIKSMESALDLGARLAKNLMNKGAVEVMTKAQTIIHGAIATSN